MNSEWEIFAAAIQSECGLVVDRNQPIAVVFGHDPCEKTFANRDILAVPRFRSGHLPIDIDGSDFGSQKADAPYGVLPLRVLEKCCEDGGVVLFQFLPAVAVDRRGA